MRKRKLGPRQAAMLRSLKNHGGKWYAGCGWVRDGGQFQTEAILETLVTRGLVEKIGGSGGRQKCYRITAEGEAL